MKTTLPVKLLRAALLACCAASAAAQDQATTLLAAATGADVVVRATVVAVTDPDPSWHRTQFRSDAVLKGQPGVEFSLLEPAGKCCGRSLFALEVGQERLLFLRRTGPTLHPFGGARGVVPVTPAVLAHVTALLAAGGDAARARVLVQGLASDEPRIAEDAAHALAVQRSLVLDAGERDQVLAALGDSVTRGSVRAAPLAEVAARLGDAAAADALLPIYLAAERDDHARLLQGALARMAPGLVAERLPIFVQDDRRANLRAADLLGRLPIQDARGAMENLLRRRNHPQVQLCLCEGLLAAGMRRADLERLVPEPVLELAARRSERPRTFRNIAPKR